MINISSTPNTGSARQELFSIDGKAYTIPKSVPGSLALKATDMIATQGEARATRWLMIHLMGEEAYRALMKCAGVTLDDIKAIREACRELVFGKDEDQEGND